MRRIIKDSEHAAHKRKGDGTKFNPATVDTSSVKDDAEYYRGWLFAPGTSIEMYQLGIARTCYLPSARQTHATATGTHATATGGRSFACTPTTRTGTSSCTLHPCVLLSCVPASPPHTGGEHEWRRRRRRGGGGFGPETTGKHQNTNAEPNG